MFVSALACACLYWSRSRSSSTEEKGMNPRTLSRSPLSDHSVVYQEIVFLNEYFGCFVNMVVTLLCGFQLKALL